MNRLTFLMAIVMLASSAALANIPRPDNTPKKGAKAPVSISTRMNISLDRDAKEARLIIPRSEIKALRAALDEMDDGSDNTAEVTAPGVSRTQTIVSGIFLSLALVFGGMWFLRSGRAATGTGKSLVALAVVAGLASAATYIYANAGPPPEARSITGKMFSQAVHIYKSGGGEVKLEAGNDDYIRFIVPDPKDENRPYN
jgi:preprotein translocase subunit SecG